MISVELLLVLVVLVALFFFIGSYVRVLREYERAVIFRLGRVLGREKGPGLFVLIPMIDRMVRVPIRTITMAIDPQDVITRDNVSLKVNAVVYYQVISATKAIVEVENFRYAVEQGRRPACAPCSARWSWMISWRSA